MTRGLEGSGEPKFQLQELEINETLLSLVPIALPHSTTKWYQLYRDITLSREALKRLKNRERIRDNVLQPLDEIDKMYADEASDSFMAGR
jgi:acyl carrier protein phosphodiesterase